MRCNISLPVSVSLTNLPTLNSVFIKTNKISDISNMNDTDTEDVDEDMNVNEDIDVDDFRLQALFSAEIIKNP